MRSLNTCTLVGHIGQAPELRTTPGGTGVLSFSMATSERWKDRQSGEVRERTDWHRVDCWGPLATTLAPMLDKGAPVLVQGSIRVRTVEQPDGSKRTFVSVQASEVIVLEKKPGGYQPPDEGEVPGGYDIPF